MKALVDKYLAVGTHYSRPVGIVGRIAGKRMAEQHLPENAWTVSLLNAQPGDHILEIGFGPGVAIQRLLHLVPRVKVVGIDYSRAMVRAASKRNAAALKNGRLQLYCGDAAQLPFKDESFDKILSIHSLYFWRDPAKVLAETLRVLKPGGSLALTLLPREKWPGGGEGNEYCRIYSGEDVAQMMERAGFTSARIEAGSAKKTFRELAVVGIK